MNANVMLHPGADPIGVVAELYREQPANGGWMRLCTNGADVTIHAQTPQQMIALGEAITAAGRKLHDEQKAAAIRAQLAEPLPNGDANEHAACEAWTTEEILRREG